MPYRNILWSSQIPLTARQKRPQSDPHGMGAPVISIRFKERIFEGDGTCSNPLYSGWNEAEIPEQLGKPGKDQLRLLDSTRIPGDRLHTTTDLTGVDGTSVIVIYLGQLSLCSGSLIGNTIPITVFWPGAGIPK